MEQSTVTVEFQLTEAEYLAATRLYFLKLKEVLVRLIVFCLLLLTGTVIMSLFVVELFPLWASIALVFLLEGFLLYMLLVEGPRRYFRGDEKFRDPYKLTFSDDGVFLKTPRIESKMGWTLYSRVIEGRDLYLLVYGKETRMMTIVPKRSFRNSDDENRFRELVRRYISDSAGLKKIANVDAEYTPKNLTPPDWR